MEVGRHAEEEGLGGVSGRRDAWEPVLCSRVPTCAENCGLTGKTSWPCALWDTNYYGLACLASRRRWPLAFERDLEGQVDGLGGCSRKRRVGPKVQKETQPAAGNDE